LRKYRLTYARSFQNGRRGIVVMCTFNKAEEISPTKTQQWTVDPGDGIPRGFAFLWQRFDMENMPGLRASPTGSGMRAIEPRKSPCHLRLQKTSAIPKKEWWS